MKPEFIPPTGRAPQDKSGGDVRRSPRLRTFANKWSGRRERLTPYAFLCPATLALGIAALSAYLIGADTLAAEAPLVVIVVLLTTDESVMGVRTPSRATATHSITAFSS